MSHKNYFRMVAFVGCTVFPIFSRISIAQQGWFSASAGAQYSHQGVFFVNADTGYVTTESGGVLATLDSGGHWADVGPDSYYHGQDVFFLNGKIGWLAQWDMRIYKTTDGGRSWSLQVFDPIDQTGSYMSALYSVFFADDNIGYAVGWKYNNGNDSALIIKTTDGGTHWSSQKAGSQDFDLYDVHFVNEDTGWIVGDGGRIFNTTDGGNHWVLQASNTSASLTSVFFRSPLVGWVVGSGGTLLKTTDGGANWAQQSNPSFDGLYSVSFPADSVGYACGNNGTVLKSTDAGATWQRQTSGTTEMLLASCFVSPDTGYIAGWDGTILKTVSGGLGPNAVRRGASGIPNTSELLQNYPNPFNPSTTITYQLLTGSYVTLKVFDVLGRGIATLVTEHQTAGNHSVTFDARNLSSGVYLYRLQSGSYMETKKLTVLK